MTDSNDNFSDAKIRRWIELAICRVRFDRALADVRSQLDCDPAYVSHDHDTWTGPAKAREEVNDASRDIWAPYASSMHPEGFDQSSAAVEETIAYCRGAMMFLTNEQRSRVLKALALDEDPSPDLRLVTSEDDERLPF